MIQKTAPNMVKMEESELTLANSDEDIRGRNVVDSAGEDIGDVKDLLIDEDEAKVRFLQVGSGGFLGIGDETFLIPVDAITHIDDNAVRVNLTRDRVRQGPTYDPTMVRDDEYWNTAYSHYGFLPFWAPGYRYPTFPRYPGHPR